MNIRKASLMKVGLITGVAAVSMLVSTVGPAAAGSPGAGVFKGWEYAPATDQPPLVCAKFKASSTDPLLIKLNIPAGTFHGADASGATATFKGVTPYFASPEGTHSNATCTAPASVSGTMDITSGPLSCTGVGATYTRRATTAIVIDVPSCSGAKVTFSGGQEVCPPIVGCPTDPNPNDLASGLVEGDYVQQN